MKLTGLDLTKMADFARREYRDRNIDVRMPNDEHWARCWVQAFITVVNTDGGKLMYLDNKEQLSKVENV